ncbi:MAG: MATE family efflux transporter [Halobacteriales archaeon]
MSLVDPVVGLFPDQSELDLTSGAIAGPLFYLALPIVITNLLQTAYNLADTFWLGQYSTAALAAISFAFPMVFLLLSLGMGLSIAGSVLVAQHTGADEPRRASYAAAQTMAFTSIAAVVLGAVSYVLMPSFIGLFGAAPDVAPLAVAYMRVIALGLVAMFGFFVFVSLMRGSGDTVTPMLVMLGTVVLNIVIDPFLIFGWGPVPELGVAGAAIATVLARTLALAVGLYILVRGERGVRIRLRELVPDLGYLRQLLRVGAPASVELTGRAVSINLMLFIVGLFSTTVVAGFGVGIRVLSVIFLPAVAAAQGVETMTGQNIGAGREDRAAATNHFAAKAMFAILAVAGGVVILAAPPIIAAFTTDPAVVDVGVAFLRTVAPTFGFMGIMRAYTGGFRGVGKTLTAAAIALVTLAGFRFPFAWFVSQVIGPQGIWLAFAASNVLGAAIAFLWFRRGTWRGVDVRDAPGVSVGGGD